MLFLLHLLREALCFGMKTQVGLAALGYAIFGVGVEIAGITVSKIIVKWFKGKGMALAMGMEMAYMPVLGTMLALAVMGLSLLSLELLMMRCVPS